MNKISQYRSNAEGGVGNYVMDSVDNYISLIREGSVFEISSSAESSDGGMSFSDTCVYLPTVKLDPAKTYYFHAKVRRQTTDQTFSIVLLNRDTYLTEQEEQFLKTITVSQGDDTQEVGIFSDVEFVFKPFSNFDSICFRLNRISYDYAHEGRIGKIAFLELSEVQNLIQKKQLGQGTVLKKIGVQTRPNALMAINGEEIRTGYSGIYELREDSVPITSFSLFEPAKDVLTQNEINEGLTSEEALYNKITSSICLFSHDKERKIVDFSLDYVYEEK